ncbi:MAG TPA: presqualene diphosphate synthase HpnD [Vicinamibacterales bacterium]|nr:presqualene diphosphate synthase HpnD [Vicinamibacterales bacterium]
MSGRNTSFYYSFLALPAPKRRAITAVWDFCRAVDDAVDEAPGSTSSEVRAAGERQIAAWRRELAACYGEGRPGTPEGRALQPIIAAFRLPREAFEAVIDGVAMDLERSRYRTFEELREYCLRVASAVGLICVEIFSYRDPAARQYAIDLGIALQLTNILRDVGTDLRRGRIYLPLDDLAAHGCSEADLQAGIVHDRVRSLLAFQARRADEYYRRAQRQLPSEDRRRLVAARIMGAIYHDTLRRVERSGYDVFSGKARPPKWRRAMIAAGVWLKTMVGR